MNRETIPEKAIWTLLILLGMILGSTQFVVAKEIPRCPQPRFTQKAPDSIYKLINPLKPTPENLKKGKIFYQVRAKPMPCKHCHGVKGDGLGPMARGFDPPPRDFTCAKTVQGVSDGQLFWIIKNGSPGTGMLAFKKMSDKKIWQIVLYIRQLAKE